MFTTILVGVDDRQGGRDALALAHALSELGGGELLAAHVYPHQALPTLGLPHDADELAHDTAAQIVRDQLAATGIDAGVQLVSDTSPGRGLHHAAEATQADLVVVGCSHRGAVGRILAGDNTRAVLQGIGVPVVVARPAGQAPPAGRVIGVGYDGSPESRAALAWAGQLAECAGATVRVVSVAEPQQAFSPSVSYGINWGALKPGQKEHAEGLVTEAVEELGECAVGEAVVGVAGEGLARVSRDVDLLVLGSRGYGAVRRTLLGSTSDQLIHDAACPVVVVPRGAADRRDAAPAPGFEVSAY